MSRFDAVRRLVAEAIAERAFPGIVLLVEHDGHEVLRLVEGARQIEPERGEAMSDDTLFDLASLTKPLATALLTFRQLHEHGHSLDTTIGRFLPEVPPPTAGLTIRSLLLHISGLPALPGIFTSFPVAMQDPERGRRHLFSLVPEAPPGAQVIYSCTGFLFLGEILKRLTGSSLRELYRHEVTEPLGLEDNLTFVPDEGQRARCAATEYSEFRSKWMRGEVHDENAWCMAGDAGNAGLFGTAGAIMKLLRLFSNGGFVDGYRVLPEEALAPMTRSETDALSERRSCGFMMGSPECPVGPLAGARSFGHTGFTGTSVWVDPDRRLSVVALTNRVHFGRDETADAIKAFRRKLHSELFRIIDAQ